ncbi:hypothetical protein L1987_17070 [Smallanthus sonchifolius]|uniref:Uncharacterized protein n=1 Tax=Smallanthus sonchifolius TaxID=185202 RepID=A0ACB9IVV3_9ASTR|nr:hypothetical protein L1987_17070 [Smallanthus sonchifolius]
MLLIFLWLALIRIGNCCSVCDALGNCTLNVFNTSLILLSFCTTYSSFMVKPKRKDALEKCAGTDWSLVTTNDRKDTSTTLIPSFSYDRCSTIVDSLNQLYYVVEEIRKNISREDISQLHFSCEKERETENNDRFSEPMVWIGIYVAIASIFCILAMAADLLHGFRNKKFWFPCKYFSLNAASITVITVTMKLPVDLSGALPSHIDQATKLGSLAFMCTMMANLMPSLASMDNQTLLANVIGLSVLVITMIVNICIQINTSVIAHLPLYTWNHYHVLDCVMVAYIYMAMMLMLLVMIISSSLILPPSKKNLDSMYLATKILTDRSLQHIQMSKVEKLRQHVRRYWIMAESGSPQFVMVRTPLFPASGIICFLSLLMNLFIVLETLLPFKVATRADHIDENLNNYVLRIDKEVELAEKTLKGVSNSMNSFISKAEKEQNNNLLELLEKSTGFKGVENFDSDQVQPLLSIELVNSWSLPIVTLTCIAVALPNIHKDTVEKLFKSVDEGLSYTHIVEESLNCASQHVNLRKTNIFSACFTNIPRVITMKCHESVIEKREESVKFATELLGKTTKIIERLETYEVPSMDHEKMSYVDEWRLYFKQSIP